MAIESPCRKICELDLSRDVCTGCGRTRAEIGSWLAMTAAERRAIMQRLAARPPDPAEAVHDAKVARSGGTGSRR